MTIEKATFAGGCFWCMVKPFHEQEGIVDVVVGYTGGHTENPTYKEVCQEDTGHYEAVEITFDTALFPYKKLLEIFWKQIDPTDPSGQFNDRGQSYQTAIFYHNDKQRQEAELTKQQLQEKNLFAKPIVTPILKASTFYIGEEYHQDYYQKNPQHYSMYSVGSGRAGFLKNQWSGEKNE